MIQPSTAEVFTLNQEIAEGLLFIPDISGFTELVHSTDAVTGKQITFELLSAIINQNRLQLNIAEVEGDAVLFYRYGAAPSLVELVIQHRMMVNAFESKRAELERSLSRSLDLSLKVIAHYGPMSEYKIGRFNKLYGEVVVEAHRLLKNSIEGSSYLLLSDALLEITGSPSDEKLPDYGIRSKKLCEVYGSRRNICFTYLDFDDVRTYKQVA